MCLNTLRSINHQQSTFAGSNGTRNLIREIDMSRRVNQIQNVFFSIQYVFHLNGMAFNGNAPFTLQVHAVEYLLLGIPCADSPRDFQQSVGKGAFTMINMSYNAKIPDVLHSTFFFWWHKDTDKSNSKNLKIA